MKVIVMPGDGIGKEVVPIAHEALKAVYPSAEYIQMDAGYERFLREGVALSEADMDLIRSCDCVLFGSVTTPPSNKYRSIILRMRKELDLYANIRPFRSYPISPYKVDFTIFRENSEDLYMGLEDVTPDEVRSVRVITRKASERIALEACKKQGIKKLTIVHKANVLRSCALFRDTCITVANAKNVLYEEMLVDAMAYNLVRDPSRYDTIVTTNLFGDILSDEAAALIGGLGLSPSANVGDKYALFEPVHGSAPDIAGKGVANPIAAVLSARMLLEWAGEMEKAKLVDDAVSGTIADGILTPDLGGRHKTVDVGKSIIKRLEGKA